MYRIASFAELSDLFRPIDREHLTPPEAGFPLGVTDYFTWSDGLRSFLVFLDPDRVRPLGVAFQRINSAESLPNMCQWCHSVRAGDGVSLMTASITPDHRVGVHLCQNLSCKDNIRGNPGHLDMRETLTSSEKMQRILTRMGKFSTRHLF